MNKFLSTIVSLVLSVFFICIMLYVMISGLNVFDSDNGGTALFFTIIDSLLLLAVVGLGKPVFKFIGIGMYAPVTVATVIYVILGMASTLLLFNSLTSFLFVLIKLVILFLFFCVAIPIAVTGKNIKRDEDTRPEIKKHNID